MYTVTVLYPQPVDAAEFDRYHDQTHIPIATRMKGQTRWTAQRIEQREQATPPYHFIVQLSAPTKAALQQILDSPEGVAAALDVPNFATGGAVFLYGEQDEIIPPP